MRIALLTDGIFPFVVGGMQKHSFYLAKYLAMNQVYVDLYHTAEKCPEDLFVFSETERKFIRSIFIPYPKFVKFPGHYLIEQFIYSKRIFSKLNMSINVDFIYSQGFTGWETVRQKKRSNTPIGVNFHGLEMFQESPDFISKLKSYLLRYPALQIIKNSDFIFSLGKKLTDLLHKLKVSSTKIIQLPIGIGEDWLNDSVVEKNAREISFLFVGRYERRKGVEELNQALLRIRSPKKIKFYFVGDIPDTKKSSFDNAIYFGKISDQIELKKIYKNCAVLICPSHAEGMPTVILEAMASGLAILATDVGAVAELVDFSNGFLMKESSEDNILKGIEFFVNSESDVISQMKRRSIEKVKNGFLWQQVVQDLLTKIKNESHKV